jgi:hypothetical protein
MKGISETRAHRLCDVFAVCSAVLSCVVVFFPEWYGTQNELYMQGAIALSLCAIFYVEWRRGMLSLPLAEMHAHVRRRGMQAFGWVRPLPLLAIFLAIAANMLMAWRA